METLIYCGVVVFSTSFYKIPSKFLFNCKFFEVFSLMATDVYHFPL